jgi:UDP-N-acetylglucosamine 4,6-dehydratase/5-epimerase
MARTVLITGGTGSFGHACTDALLTRGDRVIVFSRDELKQSEMARRFRDAVAGGRLRFFLGDVRDAPRLQRAFEALPDLVIHAAALKQVPACEYNPFEALKTNVLGAVHVIDAALDCAIPKVIALSTDKAVAPLNAYGKSKAMAESLFVRGNAYAGGRATRFSVVRYGNVLGSRGSVVPLFLEQRASGVVRITDARMTRFWMTLEAAVAFVLGAAAVMQGGEIFIPKIPAARVRDVAAAIAPDCQIVETGIRPGEKLHELLIAAEEAAQTFQVGARGYVIAPADPTWPFVTDEASGPMPAGFTYSSDQQLQPVTFRELEPCA